MNTELQAFSELFEKFPVNVVLFGHFGEHPQAHHDDAQQAESISKESGPILEKMAAGGGVQAQRFEAQGSLLMGLPGGV